jgi:2-hydroxycyclohexanecarboxyl-CoA dehydrogenase
MLSNGNQRVALVTGGARGIGAAIARGLAQDGLSVVIADVLTKEGGEMAEAINRSGGTAVAIELDVTDSASVDVGVGKARERFGQIDVLVNNAGWDQLKLFVDTDEAFWEQILDVNFKGGLRMTRAILPEMIQRRWGRVVNISSDAGRVGSSLESVYAGAKAAVIAFTKTVAREAARSGVTANVVCPGPTDTPLLREVAAGRAGGDIVLERMAKSVPMKRIAQPEDVAVAVRFFATEGAGYITGQTLSVSGGLTMA